MAPTTGRRSRILESEDEEESRPNTPNSTAPNDGKRARLDLVPSAGISVNGSGKDAAYATIDSQKDRKIPMANRGSKGKPRHQPGAIVRVKLTNFVTYTSAEFFPGPNLNMVIGPNGTGKSTLVCAICLGLGWGTQYLGRAKDLSEFIKHGSKEACIEIELQRATSGPVMSRSNPIITRTMKREGNKSAFTLNGNPAANKAVLELARGYNIQIDNLCQFLPQDKVVEFAQMTPIEILQSTQRAAASPEMLSHHENLKRLRDRQREVMGDNKGDRERLANLESRQEMQRVEVERLRERAVVQQRLDWLEQARPIPQYAEKKRLSREAREQAKSLRLELGQLHAEMAPTLQKVNAKQSYLQRVNDLRTQCDKDLKVARNKCTQAARKVDEHETRISDLQSMFDSEEKSRQPIRADINRRKGNIARLQRSKEQAPEPFDSRAMNRDIQDLTTEVRSLEDKRQEMLNQAEPLKQQGREKKSRLDVVAAKLRDLETQSGQQDDKLEKLSSHTHRAWKWIQSHRDQFQRPVFGPPIIECRVKNRNMADRVESVLQRNDFKIITVQCREDFSLLQKQLIATQRLHDVSIRMCPLDDLTSFHAPIATDQLQQHGLEGWLIDMLDGPAPVLAMLCQEKMLHRCAIARNDMTDDQFTILSKSSVSTIVTQDKYYQFQRRAEYGAAASSSNVRFLRRAEHWTDQPVDTGRKTQLQAEVTELRGELTMIKSELDTMKDKARDITKMLEEKNARIVQLREEKDEKQKILTEYNSLDTKIASEEEQIAANQENLNSIRERQQDAQSERDQVMLEKVELVLKYVETVHELREKHRLLLEADMMHVEAQNDKDTLTARHQHIVDFLQTKKALLKEAESNAKSHTKDAAALGEEVKKLVDVGNRLLEEGESGFYDLTMELSANKDITVKDLDDKIDVEKAKLSLTEGGDANAIRDFEERAKKIEELHNKLTEFTSQQENLIHAIKEVRSKWEPELDRLVARISDAFADSFARIGCAGQVAVHKASSEDPADCTEEMGGTENGLDFANWAVHISVKFRENEPLSLLDSHRQSGGERAVSTIFYLMALQSLSRAPFRVVDEINQGMDPRNERMVHGRMVDIAAADENGSDRGSQYFLITPKLLSGLKYKPGMTVLCIVSGENMPNAGDERKRDENGKWIVYPGKKVDFAAFARTARSLGLGQTRDDSGAGVSRSFGSMTAGRSFEIGA